MKMKKCSKCGELKAATLEFFYGQAINNDGLRYECKDCKKKIDNKWRDGHSDHIKEYQKSPAFVFSQLKYHAKKRGINFTITLDYYLKNLAFKSCHYCGSEKIKHWVDRYINDFSIGYTEKNTVSSCEMCNKMKMSLDPDVFISQCERIAKFNDVPDKNTIL